MEPSSEVVRGELVFEVVSLDAMVTAFADPARRDAVAAIFREALAQSWAGVEADDLRILALRQSGRRLRALAESAGLSVAYEVTTGVGSGSAVSAGVVSIPKAEVLSSLTSSLQGVDGLSEVQVVEMGDPERPEIVRVMVQLQESQEATEEGVSLLAIALGAGIIAVGIAAAAAFSVCNRPASDKASRAADTRRALEDRTAPAALTAAITEVPASREEVVAHPVENTVENELPAEDAEMHV